MGDWFLAGAVRPPRRVRGKIVEKSQVRYLPCKLTESMLAGELSYRKNKTTIERVIRMPLATTELLSAFEGWSRSWQRRTVTKHLV